MTENNQEILIAETENIGDINFDKFEMELQSELDEQLSELDRIKKDREKINNPDNLGNTVMNVVWEQFLNQLAVTAGEDFIRENRGLTLDLSNDAHIQTPENFANGKIANHNYHSAENITQNHERYKNKSHKEFREEFVDPGMNSSLPRAGKLNKEGIETVKDIYTGRDIPTNTKLENGKNNPKAAQREHVTSSHEIYQDPSLQMANGDTELAKIINAPENLQGYTTAERNNRKSNNSSDEMKSKDKNKHWEKADEKSKKMLAEERKTGEEKLRNEGKNTQKEEALRIGGAALRAVLMQLLAELMKEVIRKLVFWFKSARKNMDSLINSIKLAVKSFISKLKTHMVNAGSTALTTIATAILGPIVATIKKAWIILKQGWSSLKEAIAYIKNPDNKNKPFGLFLLEVGKIVVVGLSATGAIVLGEVIEKGLLTIAPTFAFEIPLIGSLASLIGLFFGGLIAGIIGAISLNLIDKAIAKRQTEIAIDKEIKKGNEILQLQHVIIHVSENNKEQKKNKAMDSISERHTEAAAYIAGAIDKIRNIDASEKINQNEDNFNSLFSSLKKLEE